MKKWVKGNNNEKININKLFNNILSKPVKFKKLENKRTEYSSSKKSPILLSRKIKNNNTPPNKIKGNYNNNNIKIYKRSDSKEMKSKTLNNTFHRKKRIFSIKNKNTKLKNNLSNGKNSKTEKPKSKIKNPMKFKILDKGNYSSNFQSLNHTGKRRFFKEKRIKTPKKNIGICFTNDKSQISSGFRKESIINCNYKTFYNDKSFILCNKQKSNSKYKNKTSISSKEKSFILKPNKSFNKQIHINNSLEKNKNTDNILRIRNKKTNEFKEVYNTFNNINLYQKEINSYSYYKTNNSIILNKNKKEKKPRVDSLEYLSIIMNSIKSTNLTASIANKQNEINNINNNKNDSYINIFRKKNKEKNKLSSEKTDIKKYIQVKKKLYKLSNIKKKKKEKEEELKKYLELYKLQKNILNSNNNTFYNTNTKFSKTQNFNNIDKIKDPNDINNKGIISNTNEFLSSIDSTIVDKNNFYQGIMDIQNIYSNNNFINHNIIINNYSDSNEENNNNKNIDIIQNNKNNNKNKKINSRNASELNNHSAKSSDIISNNKTTNTNNELKEEKIDEITFTYTSPVKEEEKFEEKKEQEISNKIDNKEKDDKTDEFQINELNDYSFKLNNSNDSIEIRENNEINSLQTSKFCNSQILSNENRQSKKYLLNCEELKNEKIEDNNIISSQFPPSIQLLSEKNTLENKKYEFTKDELNNYKEILTSLFEYLKLITQRNALNDIISYGDMKYKYKIGFEIIVTLIKLAPFNIIRAIQQSQYYHFAFRQLFIPYIIKSFNKLKSYYSNDKRFKEAERIIKFIYKKICIKKIRLYKMEDKIFNSIDIKKKSLNNNSNMSIKSIEELTDLLNLNNKDLDMISNKDISESKENDVIEWENSLDK